MKNSDSYIVYRHTSPSGKVYVGITKRRPKERWERGRAYRRHGKFWNAVKKYGWDNIQHEVLLEGISKSEAIYAEKYLIRWYKIHNLSYNLTDGGDGTVGHPAWNKGIPRSIETKKKIGDANRGEKGAWWHKAFPEEMKKRISEAKKGIATKVCKVVQLSLSGELIKEWDSQLDAARSLNLDGSAISKCCRGMRNKCGNFKWRYNYEDTNNKCTEVA